MKNINLTQTLEFACRLYVFFFMGAYGLAKVIGGQFYIPGSIPPEVEMIPISQTSNFDLAWVFMGRSYGYMLYIGLAELLGAMLLLFNKSKLIGTFILIPIIVNVIVFDIFFLDQFGALASAFIYFFMLLIILWINKKAVIEGLKALMYIKPSNQGTTKQKIIKYVSVAGLIIIVFAFNQVLVGWLGYGKG